MPSDDPARPASSLDDAQLMHRIEEALDACAARAAALDVSAFDGFVCGVLLQPRPIAVDRWLPWVVDADGGRGRADMTLHALAQERRDRLNAAIQRREWFDPWVFELDGPHTPSEVVAPWIAGFGLAVDVFPELMSLDEHRLLEPLALLYRHLDPDDLDDADALIEQIETLEPPADLAEAVEELVRATLLLADISRPLAAMSRGPARPPPRAPRSQGPRRGGRGR